MRSYGDARVEICGSSWVYGERRKEAKLNREDKGETTT